MLDPEFFDNVLAATKVICESEVKILTDVLDENIYKKLNYKRYDLINARKGR